MMPEPRRYDDTVLVATVSALQDLIKLSARMEGQAVAVR
jgi:hypothetical protein